MCIITTIAQLLERSPVQSSGARRRWPAGGFASHPWSCWCPGEAGPGRRLAVALGCLAAHPLSLNQMHLRQKCTIDPVSQGSYLYAIIGSNPDIHGGKHEKKGLFSHQYLIFRELAWRGRKANPNIHQNTDIFSASSAP